MNEDRNQDRLPKQQAKRTHPDPWQQDLNPGPLAGQNIGQQSDAAVEAEWTAFHRDLEQIDWRALTGSVEVGGRR